MLPSIPIKRYFTIGEVADLCGVKAHVLRYWEQEFSQLRPMKRRGNRRYYQHHEVLMIRRIRELLYDQGFTISGARNQLQDMHISVNGSRQMPATQIETEAETEIASHPENSAQVQPSSPQKGTSFTGNNSVFGLSEDGVQQFRHELMQIRAILWVDG